MTSAVVQQTAQELDSGMATMLAESIVTRLFTELEKLSNVALFDDAWFNSIIEMLVFSNSIETGFGHGKSYALAIIKQHWEDLPFALRSKFGLDFMNFARTWTGRERSTIDNYINTANVWFIGKARPNHSVKVMERDTEGRPVLDANGNPHYNVVEFNPFAVDLSKLLIVNARAAKGEMTERLWELLADPYFTCEDVRLAHANIPENGGPPDVFYTIIGPGLYMQHGSELICLAEELNWAEYETNSLVKDGIERLMRLLRVKMDEDYLYDMGRQNNANSGHSIQGRNGAAEANGEGLQRRAATS